MTTRAAEKKRRRELLRAMKPIKGFVRTINRCNDCGHLFGRQYIPHSLGIGMSLDLCGCQMTAHRPFTLVTRRAP